MDIGVIRRDGRTDAFFDGAADDRLMLRRCEPCDQWFAPDANDCPECGEEELTWSAASGEGTLVTWTVAHSRHAEPATLAIVELAEGPWLRTRLDGVTELREGLPLHAHFVHPADGESYPLFRENA